MQLIVDSVKVFMNPLQNLSKAFNKVTLCDSTELKSFKLKLSLFWLVFELSKQFKASYIHLLFVVVVPMRDKEYK